MDEVKSCFGPMPDVEASRAARRREKKFAMRKCFIGHVRGQFPCLSAHSTLSAA